MRFEVRNSYSFGMIMPGRNYRDTSYRFGFNNKEKDNELYGTGNEYNYGFRIYNPRLGRWLSPDILKEKYPNETPYLFALDNPIFLSDLDGKVVVVFDEKGNKVATISKAGVVVEPGQEKNAFLNAYMQAKSYIQKNNNSDIYTKIENSRKVLMLKPLQAAPKDQRVKGSQFDPHKDSKNPDAVGTVYWDPESGEQDNNSREKSSPAGVLTHEFVHVKHRIEDPAAMAARANNTFKVKPSDGGMSGTISATNKEYDNEEEKQTIQETNAIMKNLPEASDRTSHHGKPYKTMGVTTNVPKLSPDEFRPEPARKDNIDKVAH